MSSLQSLASFTSLCLAFWSLSILSLKGWSWEPLHWHRTEEGLQTVTDVVLDPIDQHNLCQVDRYDVDHQPKQYSCPKERPWTLGWIAVYMLCAVLGTQEIWRNAQPGTAVAGTTNISTCQFALLGMFHIVNMPLYRLLRWAQVKSFVWHTNEIVLLRFISYSDSHNRTT